MEYHKFIEKLKKLREAERNNEETWEIQFDETVIKLVYEEIVKRSFSHKYLFFLEKNGYFENYLWKYYCPAEDDSEEEKEKQDEGEQKMKTSESHSSKEHILSIIGLLNTKWFENKLPYKQINATCLDKFEALFLQILEEIDLISLSPIERITLTQFLIIGIQQHNIPSIQKYFNSIVGLSICLHMDKRTIKKMILEHQEYIIAWKKMIPNAEEHYHSAHSSLVFKLIKAFWESLNIAQQNLSQEPNSESKTMKMEEFTEEGVQEEDEIGQEEDFNLKFCEKVLEFFIDLLSQAITRRYFFYVLQNHHFVVFCKLTPIIKSQKGTIFKKLVELLEFFFDLEVDDSGSIVDFSEKMNAHYEKISKLQRIGTKYFPEKFSKSSTQTSGNMDSRENLEEMLIMLDENEIKKLCIKLEINLPSELPLCLVHSDFERLEIDKEIVIEMFVKKPSEIGELGEVPLYPTEETLWEKSMCEAHSITPTSTLPIPKLHLKFCSIESYLYVNFHLLRLESIFEIRKDLEDVIQRISPQFNPNAFFSLFKGWARMAVPIDSFSISYVAKPLIGSHYPAQVRADLQINTRNMEPHVKKEWDALREHDVLFLISFKKRNPTHHSNFHPFFAKYGIQSVRGCELFKIFDENSNDGYSDEKGDRKLKGNKRMFNVFLDRFQYKKDLENGNSTQTFHLLVRRRQKQNNFKSLLQSISSIMNKRKNEGITFAANSGDEPNLNILPEWLEPAFLGHSDPRELNFANIEHNEELAKHIDLNDTFLDIAHYEEAFEQNSELPEFCKSLQLPSLLEKNENEIERLRKNLSKFGKEKKRNEIRFTEKQVSGIISGVMKGLTIIVGPPGTGKTDVAVQIISLLLKNFKSEKILLLTHSNQALNDLFEKIMQIDINQRYLLRLGIGEKHLSKDMQMDLSRQGRIDYLLTQRIIFLEQCRKLAFSIGVRNFEEYNCDSARYLYNYQILPLWKKFIRRIEIHEESKSERNDNLIKELFPFTDYYVELMRCKAEYEKQKEEEAKNEQEFIKQTGMGEERELASAETQKTNKIEELVEESEKKEEVEKDNVEKENEKKEEVEKEEVEKEEVEKEDEKKEERKKEEEEKEDEKKEERKKEEVEKEEKKKEEEEEEIEENKEETEKEEEKEEKEIEENKEEINKEKDEEIKMEESILSYGVENVFMGKYKEDLEMAIELWREIEDMFALLLETKPLEIIRNNKERNNFYLTHQAKVIAMTSTYSALNHHNLTQIRFTYDTLIMEEASQCLDIETLVPITLAYTQLKRIILLGDNIQLPPIVKHESFRTYADMNRSLFNRFIDLNFISCTLQDQGRSRPTIVQLYQHQYPHLANLPLVKPLPSNPFYYFSNPGFQYDYQFIDVQDYNGKGETSPNPYFYQNLGEAEYAVALFMYMRMQGYPANKITILTTYNGQKFLVRDIIHKKCSWHPLFNKPKRITTVDKFQGQQNDYIILSLVRTKHIGHIRDIRRLIVAMSRARFGLYVLGRYNIFKESMELAPTMRKFRERPLDLCLLPDELYNTDSNSAPSTRINTEEGENEIRMKDVSHMNQFLQDLFNKRKENK